MSESAGRQRLACTRCNTHKMRCIKRPGSETCARCAKAGAECIFAVSRRGCRPTKKEKRQEQQDDFANFSSLDGMVLEHSAWDLSLFEDMHELPSDSTSPSAPEEIPVSPLRGLSEQGATAVSKFPSGLLPLSPSSEGLPLHFSPSFDRDVEHCQDVSVGIDLRLTKLSDQLSKCTASLPPLSMWSTGIAPVLGDFSVEDALTVTQKTIEAAREVTQPTDMASIYLLISCLHRLLDLWDGLTSRMHTCSAIETPAVAVVSPPVRLGSYTAPASSSIVLYMALLGKFGLDMRNVCHRLSDSLCTVPSDDSAQDSAGVFPGGRRALAAVAIRPHLRS